jgi:hypothetical protein
VGFVDREESLGKGISRNLAQFLYPNDSCEALVNEIIERFIPEYQE